MEETGRGDRFIRELVGALGSRRDAICERLDRLTHVFSYQKPRGAYYWSFPKSYSITGMIWICPCGCFGKPG